MASVVVTVGMGRWPFDRLVQAASRLSGEHEVFVQSGTLEYSWAGGKLILGAGDTLTVPVGLAHSYRNPSSADAIAFVIRGAAAPAAPVFAENRVAAE